MTTIRSGSVLSITARLTLLYTLGAMAAVALFATLVNWKLSSNFSIEHLRFVQAKTAELQTDLDDADGRASALLSEISKETAGTRLRQYQARVLSGDTILGQTPGMATALPVSLFAPPIVGALHAADLHQHQTGGRTWLLVSLPLRPVHGTSALRLQLAYDTTRDQQLLVDFHRALAVFFLLLVPVLIVIGRWISTRALTPVSRMVRAVTHITPAQLSTRIPETPPWPEELSGLVAAFNQMLSRLEEAFTRLSRFSADLAHELRTPLSNLSGELEVSLTRPRSLDEYRATLTSGLEECNRLTVLIENLLFLARAEHAQVALHCEYFDVAEVVGWVVARHALGAAARNVTIERKDTATLDADPILFRQALGNVLANAIRHSPDGSTISVEIKQVDNNIELSVVDHGDGIPAQHLPHLFERFTRVDPARGRSEGHAEGRADGHGTGLGLSIVRSILELHGGTATINSTVGVGTQVTLSFPQQHARPSK